MPAIRSLIRLFILLLCTAVSSAYSATPTVRVAALQFGTLNWEMDVIRHHGLDKKYHFNLKVMPVGSKNASTVALQSGAADLIYSDWVWVNRQRHNNRIYGFSPVSASAGGVYVQPDLNVSNIIDLKDLRLGIAGGSVDKSWLLLQAFSKATLNMDLEDEVEPVFAAPPLLNKLMYDQKLSASLNFWHYSARLKAKGFTPVINVDELLKGLGITTQVPLVGWVFSEQWLESNQTALNNFLLASAEAREILLTSDQEWLRIKHLTRSENDNIFISLRDEYRKGVLKDFTAKHIKALDKLYAIFAQEGGKKLTGGANSLDTELFWMPSPSGVVRVGSGGRFEKI